jgi:hypothetical protein
MIMTNSQKELSELLDLINSARDTAIGRELATLDQLGKKLYEINKELGLDPVPREDKIFEVWLNRENSAEFSGKPPNWSKNDVKYEVKASSRWSAVHKAKELWKKEYKAFNVNIRVDTTVVRKDEACNYKTQVHARTREEAEQLALEKAKNRLRTAGINDL